MGCICYVCCLTCNDCCWKDFPLQVKSQRGIHLLDLTETAEIACEPQNHFIIDSQTYHKMRSDDWLYLQENVWSKRNYHSALCFSLTLEDIIYPPMHAQGGVPTYNGVRQHSQQLQWRLLKGANNVFSNELGISAHPETSIKNGQAAGSSLTRYPPPPLTSAV